MVFDLRAHFSPQFPAATRLGTNMAHPVSLHWLRRTDDVALHRDAINSVVSVQSSESQPQDELLLSESRAGATGSTLGTSSKPSLAEVSTRIKPQTNIQRDSLRLPETEREYEKRSRSSQWANGDLSFPERECPTVEVKPRFRRRIIFGERRQYAFFQDALFPALSDAPETRGAMADSPSADTPKPASLESCSERGNGAALHKTRDSCDVVPAFRESICLGADANRLSAVSGDSLKLEDDSNQKHFSLDSSLGPNSRAALSDEISFPGARTHSSEALQLELNKSAENAECSTIYVYLYPDGYSFSETGYPRFSFDGNSDRILFCLDQGVLPSSFEFRAPKRADSINNVRDAVILDYTRPRPKKFHITLRPDYLNICLAIAESPYARELRQADRVLQLEAELLKLLHVLDDLEPRLDHQTLSSHTESAQVLNFARTARQHVEVTFTRSLPLLRLFLTKRMNRNRRSRGKANIDLASQMLLLVAGNENLNRYRRMRMRSVTGLPRQTSSLELKTPADIAGAQPLRRPSFSNVIGRLLRQLRFVLHRASATTIQPKSNEAPAVTNADEPSGQLDTPTASDRNARPASRSGEPRIVCLLDIIVRPQRGCECVIRRGQEKNRDLDILRIPVGSERNAHIFANQFRRLMRGEGFVCEQDLTLPSENRVTGEGNASETPAADASALRLTNE